MATRRKKTRANGDGTTRAFTVVVEEMRGQFRVFGEQLGLLNDKFDLLDDKVTAGFAQMDARFVRVENDIAVLKDDVAEIKNDIADIKCDVGRLQTASLEQGRELRKKMDRDELEPVVERVIARTARH